MKFGWGIELHLGHLLQAGQDLVFEGQVLGNTVDDQAHGFRLLGVGAALVGQAQGHCFVVVELRR